jgi:hypothetical protein
MNQESRGMLLMLDKEVESLLQVYLSAVLRLFVDATAETFI